MDTFLRKLETVSSWTVIFVTMCEVPGVVPLDSIYPKGATIQESAEI